MSAHAWQKGQTVYLEFLRVHGRTQRGGCDAVITKIGRTWGEVMLPASQPLRTGPHRFRLDDGFLDGGGFSAPGRLHADKAAFLAKQQADDLWVQLRRDATLQYRNRPDGVTADHIRAAAQLLRIELPGVSGG